MSTVAIDADDYLEFVEREYLAGYISRGGASVKLLCPAEVDAATTRVHLIDQVFTAVARQLDWVALADSVVRSALDRAGFPVPAGSHGIDLGAIARHHDVDAAEALRSGVPSRDAVAALGGGQAAIEDRFESMLASVTAGDAGSMLIGGGFGAGKSHLLEHLARLALHAGCTVSRVVISKETPLYDPAKIFRAAADSAARTGQARPAIIEAAAGLDLEARPYAELLRWASSSGSELNERFPVTLSPFAHLRERDAAFAETILRAQ